MSGPDEAKLLKEIEGDELEFEFHMNDIKPEIIARNIILLYLLHAVSLSLARLLSPFSLCTSCPWILSSRRCSRPLRRRPLHCCLTLRTSCG